MSTDHKLSQATSGRQTRVWRQGSPFLDACSIAKAFHFYKISKCNTLLHSFHYPTLSWLITNTTFLDQILKMKNDHIIKINIFKRNILKAKSQIISMRLTLRDLLGNQCGCTKSFPQSWEAGQTCKRNRRRDIWKRNSLTNIACTWRDVVRKVKHKMSWQRSPKTAKRLFWLCLNQEEGPGSGRPVVWRGKGSGRKWRRESRIA